jgi:tRNA (cytidine/uridine-2'-O-)-methyltransferase
VLSLALYEPEIPPNTGNIARLCAAMQVPLHIVGYPAFQMSDRAVKRAGLDYWPYVDLHRHSNMEAFKLAMPQARLLYFTTKAQRAYTDWNYQAGDCLVFGPETRGLPEALLNANPEYCLTIPMPSPHVRSLNLATAAAMVLGEALRQLRSAPAER